MTKPTKAALRTQLRAARDAFVLDLVPGEREQRESRAAANLAPLLDGAHCIAFYLALGCEIDCGPAVAAAAARGVSIALPYVIDRNSALRFLAWAPGDPLESGWSGLVQPAADAAEASPDVVVAPLLGFDSELRRLGQGAGFYDFAFAARPHIRRIGFGWSIQQCPAIACDAWDVPLDAVVTEAGVIQKGHAS